MKKLLLYSLPFCLLVINSCRKNPLPVEPSSGDPVFYFKCDEAVALPLISAGVNDYYMTASHYQNTDNVYVYQAELKQKSCSNDCGYSIKILINDNKVSAKDTVMNPDQGLAAGNYEFNDGNLPPWGYEGSFKGLAPSTYSFTWLYSDCTKGIDDQMNEHFFKAGANSVTLTVDNKLGDVRTLSNIYEIGNPLQTNLSVKWNNSLSYSFTASPTLINGNLYDWEFGDLNTLPDGTNPTCTHEFTVAEYYAARVTVRNGSNTCVANYQVPATVANVNMNNANFTSSFTPVPNTKKLSTITILLTDKNGNVYTSESLDQGENKFEIVSVEDYNKSNAAGEFTKKLKIKFNCTVKNGSDPITITNGEAFIAVSYR